MTTPQNPGDGDTPQDPSDPQNPYGTPPPPPSAPPPSSPPSGPPAGPPEGPPSSPPPSAPPAVPPSAPPSAPPAAPPSTPIPAAPTTQIPAVPPPTPPYGDAQPGAAAPPPPPPAQQPVPPAYGQPAPPAYGQGPMPAYGAPNAAAEPGKGMAITALVAAILGCTCLGIVVAVPLALVVLIGKRGGKGLAIAALVLSVIWAIVLVIGGKAALDEYHQQFPDIAALDEGDCLTADGLTDQSETGITAIHRVSCTTKHDGEVLATHKLTGDETDSFASTTPLDICTPPVTEAGSAALLADPSKVIVALTQDASPKAGDKLVCVIVNADGSSLSTRVGS